VGVSGHLVVADAIDARSFDLVVAGGGHQEGGRLAEHVRVPHHGRCLGSGSQHAMREDLLGR
jgi:hypothetical protein